MAQNLWARCHGWCSVVYFEVQIVLIYCKITFLVILVIVYVDVRVISSAYLNRCSGRWCVRSVNVE